MENLEMTKKGKLYSLFHRFLCCFPNKEKDNEELDLELHINSENDNTNKYSDIINGIQSFFPIMYLREDEKNYFQFTQDFIINFISELSQKNFINKYDDSSLKLSILSSEDNVPIIRSEIIFKKILFKKEVPTIESLASCILIPEKRLKVDKNFKKFKILKKINNNAVITDMISTSQLTMISELEFIEKRTYFFDNGVFYYFCSSIPDEIYPKKDIERALNYFGVMVIKEDIENFYIDTFNKVGIKMDIPEVLIVMSFPMKMKEFFDGLLNYFNN